MERTRVTHTRTNRRLGRLPSGRSVAVTVHRYEGGDGPTAYVQAGQHGIELNGPAVLRRLHADLQDAEIAGTVVVVPLSNPLAFDHRSYMTPAAYDARNPNLNRVWPGDGDGTLAERLAAGLWKLASDADAVVDLHTGSADMLEHVRFREGDTDARELAAAFGTTYLLADPDGTNTGGSGGKFRTAAASEGLPALTVELANSRTVNHAAVEAGVTGVRNVLRTLDVLGGTPTDPPDRTVLRDALDPPVATESGLFEPRTDLQVGDHVDAGDALGTLFDPSTFERRERVTVDDGGVVYSLRRGGVTFAGERLAAVAPRA